MVRNVIGFIVGYLAGSVVNFALIMFNTVLMPAGTTFTTPEGVNAAMGQLGAINFAIVFLAHALGAFVGALVAASIAASHKFPIALATGVLFLIGGIYAAAVIDAPIWFEAVDILFAYIPFAYFGAKLGGAGKAH